MTRRALFCVYCGATATRQCSAIWATLGIEEHPQMGACQTFVCDSPSCAAQHDDGGNHGRHWIAARSAA